MSLDLSPLDQAQRLLFTIPLEPILGQRFQPTGFPGLGAATFQAKGKSCLLVESTQSMANRLELTVWDEVAQDVKRELQGLSHVRVIHKGGFLTDSILEAHRLNSPYVLKAKMNGNLFFDLLGEQLKAFEIGTIDRRALADSLFALDVSSLIHGVFLSANINKKTLAGGRLRVARALSAFIEAGGVQVAASGGVKNDPVNPSGDTKTGFGNIPFARDEFTADDITLYVNLDLAQIRGYGLGAEAERLLILLALYKLRALLEGNLRLRTACDLKVAVEAVTAVAPAGFVLPSTGHLAEALKAAIEDCKERMSVTEVVFEEELKKAKEEGETTAADGEQDDEE